MIKLLIRLCLEILVEMYIEIIIQIMQSQVVRDQWQIHGSLGTSRPSPEPVGTHVAWEIIIGFDTSMMSTGT